MNDSTIKVGLVFLGFAGGLVTGKILYKEYYNRLAQEEIESVREVFENRKKMHIVREEKEDGETTEEEETEEHKLERSNRNPLARSSLDGNPYEQVKRDYNLIGKKNTDEELGDEIEKQNQTVVNNSTPYKISEQEFFEEFEEHDKVTLYYYLEDAVLCSDYDDIINDIDGTVGDNLDDLVKDTSIWVRNESSAIDYEIIGVQLSYAETIHGVGTEPNLSPREKYERKMKRRKEHEE